MLELKNIYKAFDKKVVISNFSLTLNDGERLALIAYSGSGKTTLFRIIAGLDKRFEGKRIVNSRIAYVFQEDRLFEKSTVLENVTVVANKDKALAERLLTELGLADSINLYPDSLSGGMKRRVEIARALFSDAELVLLDECFNGLDDETKSETARVINRYTENKTVLLITHDQTEAKLLNCNIAKYDTFNNAL